MSFFEDVKSFFGMGEQEAGPITVPVPGSEAPANDPNVMAAQAKFTAACAREDALKAREADERAAAEARLGEDWQRQVDQARAATAAAQAELDQARASQNLPANAGKDAMLAAPQVDLGALSRKVGDAQSREKALDNLNVFRLSHPVENYMDKAFVAELKLAGLARMEAHAELEDAKRAASSAVGR